MIVSTPAPSPKLTCCAQACCLHWQFSQIMNSLSTVLALYVLSIERKWWHEQRRHGWMDGWETYVNAAFWQKHVNGWMLQKRWCKEATGNVMRVWCRRESTRICWFGGWTVTVYDEKRIEHYRRRTSEAQNTYERIWYMCTWMYSADKALAKDTKRNQRWLLARDAFWQSPATSPNQLHRSLSMAW